MPNDFIKFGIDLLPNSDLTYNLGLVNNSTSLRWNIFGDVVGTVTAAGPAAQGNIYGIAYYSDANGTFASTPSGDEGKVLVGHKENNTFLAPSWYEGLSLTSTTTNDITTYLATFSNNVIIGGTLNVTGASTLSNTLEVAGATTLSNTLSVTSTSKLTGNVGINDNPESGANAHNLYVNGTTKLNDDVDVNGDIIPTTSKTLGTTDHKWSALYIGSTNSYGDAYTPIYWNSGVPAEVMPIQYKYFSITGNSSNSQSIDLTSPAFNALSYVLEIVVEDSAKQYLEAPINWNSYDNGNKITLTTKVTNGQAVTGYILVSRGGEAPILSS